MATGAVMGGGDGGDAALTNCKADKTDTKSSKMFKQ